MAHENHIIYKSSDARNYTIFNDNNHPLSVYTLFHTINSAHNFWFCPLSMWFPCICLYFTAHLLRFPSVQWDLGIIAANYHLKMKSLGIKLELNFSFTLEFSQNNTHELRSFLRWGSEHWMWFHSVLPAFLPLFSSKYRPQLLDTYLIIADQNITFLFHNVWFFFKFCLQHFLSMTDSQQTVLY